MLLAGMRAMSIGDLSKSHQDGNDYQPGQYLTKYKKLGHFREENNQSFKMKRPNLILNKSLTFFWQILIIPQHRQIKHVGRLCIDYSWQTEHCIKPWCSAAVMGNSDRTYNVSNGSGCGSVGRVVASNARVPRFESNHRQFFKNTYLLTVNCTGKAKIKKKRPSIAHLKTMAGQ